jgi:hypothetical protein
MTLIYLLVCLSDIIFWYNKGQDHLFRGFPLLAYFSYQQCQVTVTFLLLSIG